MPVQVFTPAEIAAATKQAITPTGGCKMNVVSAPAPGMDSLCCAIISVNGALQSMNLLCRTDMDLYAAVGNIVSRRNAHIRHEDTRAIEVWFGVTPEFAQQKALEVKAANKDGRLASEIFPDDPIRILSQPITEAPDEYSYF